MQTIDLSSLLNVVNASGCDLHDKDPGKLFLRTHTGELLPYIKTFVGGESFTVLLSSKMLRVFDSLWIKRFGLIQRAELETICKQKVMDPRLFVHNRAGGSGKRQAHWSSSSGEGWRERSSGRRNLEGSEQSTATASKEGEESQGSAGAWGGMDPGGRVLVGPLTGARAGCWPHRAWLRRAPTEVPGCT